MTRTMLVRWRSRLHKRTSTIAQADACCVVFLIFTPMRSRNVVIALLMRTNALTRYVFAMYMYLLFSGLACSSRCIHRELRAAVEAIPVLCKIVLCLICDLQHNPPTSMTALTV